LKYYVTVVILLEGDSRQKAQDKVDSYLLDNMDFEEWEFEDTVEADQ